MRDINRSAIPEIIRRESPISRTAIAERLGGSLPTVMRIVDELAADGFVRSQGESEWSRYTVNTTGMMAGGILVALPPVILGLIFQRYIVSGMTAGEEKHDSGYQLVTSLAYA
jgi:DNA-binding transcriptional ArsR family regulator